MTRSEHIAWAKQRALEYVAAGKPAEAISSITSDLCKHEETQVPGVVTRGFEILAAGHPDMLREVRQLIEGIR